MDASGRGDRGDPGDPGDPGATGLPTPTPEPTLALRPDWMRWALVLYGAMAAASLAWCAAAGTPWAYVDAEAASAGPRWGRDLALGVAVAAAVIALSHAITTRTAWGEAVSRELGAMIGRLSLSQCIALALFSGVAEEVFFRGLLQPRVGWVVASLLFGLAHLAPRRALWPWTGFAFVAGFGFGALFLATGNLVAPVSAHVGINAVNLNLLSRRYGGARDRRA